jgi:hypothetical protein
MTYKCFSILLALFTFGGVQAQELNCQVNVVVDNKVEVSSTEQEIINQMKQSITEIMNNTAWTKDKFKVEERINCNLQIQIREIPATGAYRGDIQVSSVRPAFNSNYNSTVFNFQDENFQASFSRGAVLNYVPNQYRDNLTSILAFYAYFIIGMDYDSFSLKGGTAYFQEAQQIVTLAQTGGAAGWKSSESSKRNRFYLVDNMLQPVFEPQCPRLCKSVGTRYAFARSCSHRILEQTNWRLDQPRRAWFVGRCHAHGTRYSQHYFKNGRRSLR